LSPHTQRIERYSDSIWLKIGAFDQKSAYFE
jgi:hypothetical protein